MASVSIEEFGQKSAPEPARPLAPWWHTGLVLLVLAAGSVSSALQAGFPNAHIPGLNIRLSSYVTVLIEEWSLAALILLACRRRGVALRSLVSGQWRTLAAFARDVAIALAFTILAVPVTGVLMYLIGANGAALSDLVAHNGFEVAVWLALAATAGFCEELIFRGYLMQQFSALTGSRLFGLVLQGAVFGLAHGYYHRGMAVVMVQGCLLGALAQWRKSLRPGMLAHGLQDSFGGVVGFLAR